jgi:hypothetical protein
MNKLAALFHRVWKLASKLRAPATRAQLIRRALGARGIAVSEHDAAQAATSVCKRIKVDIVNPESMRESETAELYFDGSQYHLVLCILRVTYDGKLSERAHALADLGVCFAAASEIAVGNGRREFAIVPGKRIGLCDLYGFAPSHPIQTLFSLDRL